MRTLVVTLICGLAFSFGACSRDRANGDDGDGLEHALRAVGEAAEGHALRNGGLFADTTAPIYCRGGVAAITADDSVFTTIGFQPDDDTEDADFCYNVSDDRKRVSLSVAENPLAEEVLCLTIDLTGEEPMWSEVTTTSSCRP